jgi:progressive ankylosis protein
MSQAPRTLPMAQILRTWWPLAASWVLMGFEGPAVAAVISRMADPKINLAAWGGIVFPLSLMVEAPIIMMLAASTALCRDWASYVKLRRFMMRLGAALTAIHVIMVATPLYYVIVRDIMHAPEEIIAPARLGLLIMIPWTWSIAYRRFHQGILIRFGHSLKVGLGTVVRFAADATVLAVGYFTGGLPGIAVAGCGMIAGVLSEAFYVHLAVRPTLRSELKPAPAIAIPLSTRAMLDFYIPLSLTQVLMLIANPIGSAAMGRMPWPLLSLAAWPVVGAVRYITGSFGGSYNEVMVALVERERSVRPLRRFAVGIGVLSTAILGVLMIPAVSEAIFADLMNLADPLPAMVHNCLFLLLPIPAIAVWQSYFQGAVLHARRTRSITESVVVFLVVAGTVLVAGVIWGGAVGLYVAVGAFVLGEVVRTAWLWLRSRHVRAALHARDATA